MSIISPLASWFKVMSSETPPPWSSLGGPGLVRLGVTPAAADHAVAPRPLWNDAAATPHLDAMRRALVADLSRHFPLDPSSTEVGVVLICGDSEDASMDWAGLVLTLPSVADPEDDEENDGEEAGSLWVKPLHMDGPRARDEKKKRAKTKRGGDLVLVSAEDPPPLSLARPTAPVVRLSVSKDSPVQKIDGAGDHGPPPLHHHGARARRFGALEPRSRRGPRARPDEGPRREPIDRHFGVRVRPGERELAEELSRGLAATGEAPGPLDTKCLPSSPTVRRRERSDPASHDGNGSDGDEYTHGGDEYEYDDTPGTTVVFEGTSRQTARRVPGVLPAPVSNPLFDDSRDRRSTLTPSQRTGRRTKSGLQVARRRRLAGQGAAVLRDALRSSNAASWSCRGPT